MEGSGSATAHVCGRAARQHATRWRLCDVQGISAASGTQLSSQRAHATPFPAAAWRRMQRHAHAASCSCARSCARAGAPEAEDDGAAPQQPPEPRAHGRRGHGIAHVKLRVLWRLHGGGPRPLAPRGARGAARRAARVSCCCAVGRTGRRARAAAVRLGAVGAGTGGMCACWRPSWRRLAAGRAWARREGVEAGAVGRRGVARWGSTTLGSVH